MNEERLEAYLKLIYLLLICPSGEEPLILNANQELLDAELVQVMQQLAETLAEQGKHNLASWLKNFASQLLKAFTFLAETWQATFESGSDPQVVYPYLEANLDKLDEQLAQIIPAFFRHTLLPNVEIGQLPTLVSAIASFANLIIQCPLGDRANNIEIAISCYQTALEVFTFESLPEQWAATQKYLGHAYSNRIRGEQAENLEQAIIHYKNALKVFTQTAFPDEWATIEAHLGDMYRDRIYGELSENLDLAIACYENALEIINYDSSIEYWIIIKNSLGNSYDERVQGQPGDNLSKAIEHYVSILEKCDREKLPEHWARTQYNLGNTYINSYLAEVCGSRSTNLEQAIQCYENAVEFLTRTAYPVQWANAQHQLGYAYQERIEGERQENLEKAIACYQQALLVRTYEEFPEDWATTQHNMGNAYYDRRKGNRAENLEKAINCFKNALKVRTYEKFPKDWAASQLRLGEVYRNRIRGDLVENLEKAIDYCRKALQVWTREDYPREWAGIQHTLGGIYLERIKGSPAENLEQSINFLKNALQFFTHDTDPEQWSRLQADLLAAYASRIKGTGRENIDLAFSCFKNALLIFYDEIYPEEWAQIQYNLANAYVHQLAEEMTQEEFEEAIYCYHNSLRVRTQEKFPQKWAMLQNSLGNAYSLKICEEQREKLEQAVVYYQNALKILTYKNFPYLYTGTLFNLGVAYKKARHFYKAYDVFKVAFEAVNSLRSEVESGELAKQKFAEKWFNLHWLLVATCLELGASNPDYYARALEYVERGKSLNLVELLTGHDLQPRNTPKSVGDKFRNLHREIASLQRCLDIEEYHNYASQLVGRQSYMESSNNSIQQQENEYYSTQLERLRKQLNELIEQEIKPLDPTFCLTQKVEAMTFKQIQQLLPDAHTALVEWYFNREMLIAFIVTPKSPNPIIWQTSLETQKAFKDWLKNYIDIYYDSKKEWQVNLGNLLKQLADILDIDKLISLIPDTCKQLILIPSQYLHWLPLHALPLGNRMCLLDHFPHGVRYAPSCQLLQLSQRQQRPEFSRLFAIQNPSDNLSYTDLEVKAICSFFPDPRTEVLASQDASEAAIKVNENFKTAHCNHFSCHGYFNPSSPLESALLLAESQQLEEGKEKGLDDGYLTLSEIFELNLQHCRLVTLSACETGLTDVNLSDECISLTSGFLVAGTPAVVSSLWTVNDLSTAFLMIKFYENLHHQMSLALALNQAQLWLRDLTKEELQEWIDNLPWSLVQKLVIKAQFHELSSTDKPFREPYHWAAFCAIGQ